jgi:hypothetical protein
VVRTATDSIKRKVNSLSPGARELAIKTGMELHDSYAEANEKRREERIKQEFELIRQEYAGKVEARAKKMVAEMDLGTSLPLHKQDFGTSRWQLAD